MWAACTSALGWFHRQVHGGGHESGTVWFQLRPAHPDLWGGAPVEPVVLDARVRRRLVDGLRLDAGGQDAGLVFAVAPAPRPTSTVERSYAGLASLLRQSPRCIVGVPEDAADRMPWASAGCGLLASRLDAFPTGARPSPPDATVSAAALPGWMVGMDDHELPVVAHLPPGSTVLVTGKGAARVAATLAPSAHVPGQDVVVVSSCAHWREAWHPQRCRVVVAGVPGQAASLVTEGVVVDLTVDLDAGKVSVRGRSVGFTPLPLRG